jgi:hypothetical protein
MFIEVQNYDDLSFLCNNVVFWYGTHAVDGELQTNYSIRFTGQLEELIFRNKPYGYRISNAYCELLFPLDGKWRVLEEKYVTCVTPETFSIKKPFIYISE